jgi:hypothetical protein
MAGQRVTRAALSAYYPKGDLHRRLVPLPEYGCIYVKNLKAGCTTVTLWLHRIHTGDHGFVPQTNRHRELRTPRPWEVGWGRVMRMLRGEAYRFTFVRDPIRRAESAYLDKVVHAAEDTWRARVRQALELPDAPGEPVALDTFVAALEATDPLQMDPHWRPQHLNLMHPLVTYDHIGRLENFDADLAAVGEAAGLPHVPVEVRNRTKRPDESLFNGRPDLRRRVEAVYARDFELYGY